LREELGGSWPFITENGGGIYLPVGLFRAADMPAGLKAEERDGLLSVPLGEPYPKLRLALQKLREAGFDVRGFGDMSVEEVGALTGLGNEEARRAKEREFDEPFVFARAGEPSGRPDEEGLRRAVASMGLATTRGRFHHLTGRSDKGTAARIVRELYEKLWKEEVTTAAIGDSPNDAPMFAVVDRPFLVQQPDGRHCEEIDAPGLRRVDAAGPAGFRRAIEELLGL
jgi:mannosyl-3-phosphoglycerate phosphatase